MEAKEGRNQYCTYHTDSGTRRDLNDMPAELIVPQTMVYCLAMFFVLWVVEVVIFFFFRLMWFIEDFYEGHEGVIVVLWCLSILESLLIMHYTSYWRNVFISSINHAQSRWDKFEKISIKCN